MTAVELPALELPAPPSRGARVTVRQVGEHAERLLVRRSVAEPIELSSDLGCMVTVWPRHGVGYCATACLSPASLRRAAQVADEWARLSESRGVFAAVDLHALLDRIHGPASQSGSRGRFPMTAAEPMPPRSELLELLRQACESLRIDDRIIDRSARLVRVWREQALWVDGQLWARRTDRRVEPNLEATAAQGGIAQTRSLGGQYNGFCQQGGFEVIRASGLAELGAQVADEALQLLMAPECPTDCRDLLLMPDQMMLQIHESIGHPLELDRILGDERNFAGTSFVRLEDFGHLQYGSELLNVRFDPGVPGELASYGADDEGELAEPVWLIRNGRLERPLGAALSIARAHTQGFSLQGCACARSIGWHRPAIDRMANLNLEPGESRLQDMIARVDRGILMKTNVSWSIDDARNKFQFGCEWGQLIESGRLGSVVRNPGYRGVSSRFWQSLAAVGDRSSLQILGTPFCGKGEPGQVIPVGHASPPCLFREVEVFGGDG